MTNEAATKVERSPILPAPFPTAAPALHADALAAIGRRKLSDLLAGESQACFVAAGALVWERTLVMQARDIAHASEAGAECLGCAEDRGCGYAQTIRELNGEIEGLMEASARLRERANFHRLGRHSPKCDNQRFDGLS